MTRSLRGKRVLVVGASSGIGRAFAIQAGKEGAQVVLVARRKEKLDDAIAEAGTGTPVAADIADPAGAAAVAEAARTTLGEVDLLFCSVGVAPLKMFADTDSDDWESVMRTNVVGVHQLIRHALPVLAEGAIVGALSSESVGQQRAALGAYAASKAALMSSFDAWRTEHPGLRFCTIAVGSTIPTEFADAFDPELLGSVLEDWIWRGLVQETLMTPDAVADAIAGMLAGIIDHPDVGLDHAVIKPPSAPRRM
ncbi:SDR family oxidoreductase [uncultured Williamsia sp.]|uniref:SDR family oxidoreductase n=1 Tax=uncultured Williamsia sp. TaxID=259311 RepID=UPI00262A1465|nr:SDR family oxidoreductase [uncultured Williamsia sp.]